MNGKPPTWHHVYPHGTPEGDEEMSFFYALARKKWEWVSTAQLVKESGLKRERVEEIISKYLNWKPQLIFQSSTKDDHWAYWERVPDLLVPSASIGDRDKGNRINKQLAIDDPFSNQVIVVAP